MTHTHVLCRKRYYFLAGLKDALGEPLFSQPELQLSLRWTVSTLRHNLPGQWAPRLGARLFATSTAFFLDVAPKADKQPPEFGRSRSLLLPLARRRSRGRWEEELGRDTVGF